MIFEHGQRMTAAAIAERDMSLEVHLPEQVRRRLLEALDGCRPSWRRHNPPMPLQNLMHRRAGRSGHPLAFETAHDLARAPGRMRIAHRKHSSLHRRFRPARARVRTPRAIRKLPLGCKAAEPRVPGGRMNPEPAAQLPPVGSFLHRKLNKLTPLLHDRHLLPRHGSPPSGPNPCNDDVSAMSPDTRR